MSRSIRVLVALAVGLAGFGLSAPAVAADNSTLPVCGSCGVSEVFANKDIGGVKFPKHILHNGSGTEVGTQASPLYFGFGTGITLPAFASTPTFNLGTLNGAATAANQTAAAAAKGEGATGAAVPSGAQYMGINSGGNLTGWNGAVSQSGTWTVQPGNTANTTPWLSSISQGGNTAVVKAANTVATTDVGVVVAVANTLSPGQAAAASSSPVVVAKNSGTGSTVAGAAVGTAGSAATEVVTVQGIASMTPFLSNPGTAANWGIGATAAAVPANAAYYGFNSGGNLTGVSSSAPLPVRPGDGTRNAIIDPCAANLQSYATGVITSATTTRIVAPSASNKTYACMFFVKASAADSVGVYEGTGGTCGTGKAGVLGGTTTANGLVFGTAGDGLLLQAGGKVASMQTAGTNVDLCLETSTAGPLVYAIKYVQAP